MARTGTRRHGRAAGRGSRKNRLALPAAALREADPGPGDILTVEADEPDGIVLLRHRSRLDGVTGLIPGFEHAVDLDALRGDWEPPPTTVVLDSGVAVALNSDSDALHDRARAAFARWEEESATFVLPALVWAELRAGAILLGGEAEAALAGFREQVIDRIVPIDAEIAAIAARLRIRNPGLRWPDALVVATGQQLGTAVVLTGDPWLGDIDTGLMEVV